VAAQLRAVQEQLAADAARAERVACAAREAAGGARPSFERVLQELAAAAAPACGGPVRPARARLAAHFRARPF
jgi:hypothetical protein